MNGVFEMTQINTAGRSGGTFVAHAPLLGGGARF